MVIDTSALIAILEQEQDAGLLAEALAADATRLISAATLVEAGLVIVARRGVPGGDKLDRLLRELNVETVPITVEHARLAREGFLCYGKGRHTARLNYGDCFVYALAKLSGHAILCKGGDFSQTDASVVPVPVTPPTAPRGA